MLNTFMGFSHGTYGKLDDVIESAKRQSKGWEQRISSPKPPKSYAGLLGAKS